MEYLFPLIFGIIVGFVIQKSRLCCYEGLTSALIIRNYRIIKIIIWAILVAMIAFHLLASLGIIETVVLPFFWPGIILGSILFGISIVLAGGCMIGVMLKGGSGFLNYFIVFLGLFSGLAFGRILIFQSLIRAFNQLGLQNPKLPNPTLASFFHLDPWIVVAISSFLLIWFLYRLKDSSPEIKKLETQRNSLEGKIFRKHWPPSIIGTIIGILMVIGFARWNIFPLPTFFRDTSSFDVILTRLPSFLWFMLMMMGILLGIGILAVTSGEFRIRWFGVNKKKLLLMYLAGLMMGMGMILMNGCIIIHLFVMLPQLSLGSFSALILMLGTVWLITYFKFLSPGSQGKI